MSGRIEYLDAVWRGLWAAFEDDPAVPDDGWRQPTNWSAVCKKPLETMISAKSGLGEVPRFLCMLDFTGHAVGKFFVEADKRVPAGGSLANAHRMLELGNDKVNNTERFHAGIVVLVNRQRKKSRLQGELSRQQLFGDKFSGPDAVSDFVGLLKSHIVEGITRPFEADNDAERQGMLSDLDMALDGPIVDGAPNGRGPLLINIHAETMWEGLSAVAGHIRGRNDPHNRRILVIPLVERHKSTSDDEISVSILNFPEILGRLRGMITRQKGEFHDEEGLFKVIHDLRVAIAAEPVVIVFDGHFVSDNPSYLVRRVADDHFDSLVTRLLDPPLASGDQPFDLQRFALNRIVVTSNRPIPFASQVLAISHPNGSVALPLSAPVPDNRKKIRERHVQGILDETKAILSSAPFAERRGDIEHLVDSYVRIAADRGRGPVKFPKLDPDLPDREALKVLVRQLLQDLLALRPTWVELLWLIASVPDGMRRSTIHRFARLSTHLSHNPRPFIFLASAEVKGELDAALDALHKAAPYLVGPYRSDSFVGAPGIAHPFEFGLAGVDVHPNDPVEAAFDIAAPDVKAIIREHAKEHMGVKPKLSAGAKAVANPWQMMHRLLAEDALQQQTVSLRYSDQAGLQTIRPWRRLLSALYHGLLSLPIDAEGTIAPVDFGVRGFSTLADAGAFWRYLFAFVYRRMLEGPPHWSLSRYYGLDELKLQILLAFDRPWMLETAQEPEGPGVADRQAEQGAGKLRDDLVQSQVLARIAIGNLPEAEDIVDAEMRRLAVKEESDLSILLRHAQMLKRSMDIGLLKGMDIRSYWETPVRSKLLNVAGDTVDRHLAQEGEAIAAIAMGGGLGGVLGAGFDDLVGKRSQGAGLPDLDKLVDMLGIDSAPRLSALADLYLRLAEFHATRADFAYAQLSGMPAIRHQIPMMKYFRRKTEKEIVVEFGTSLATYLFAEQLRLRAFNIEPLGTEYFASAHPTRQSVRVALKLEHFARGNREDKDKGRMGLFAAHARRLGDTLTRHQFRYPRERAGQMVLEATMLRYLAPEGKKLEWLLAARQHLALAETLVLGLGRKARVRMRLSFERAKVHRDLIPLYAGDEAERARLIECCEYDVHLLTEVAHELLLPVWLQLAAFQRHALDLAKEGKP